MYLLELIAKIFFRLLKYLMLDFDMNGFSTITNPIIEKIQSAGIDTIEFRRKEIRKYVGSTTETMLDEINSKSGRWIKYIV